MFTHVGTYCGFGALGADNAPVGESARGYYQAGTPFLWLAPAADFGFAFSTDPGRDARNTLAAVLANSNYRVRVIYGQRGGPLEVSGTQGIDRSSALHIREQITQAAEQAGFYLTRPVQFNVESSGSSFRVGAPGSNTIWGDRTPVVPTSIFNELGVDLTGDTSFVGGSVKNLILYGAIGLVAFALITRKR
jgi:hypothetical protein